MNKLFRAFPRAWWIAVPLLLALSGCALGKTLSGLGRSAAGGAVVGAREQLGNDTTRMTLDTLIGSVTASVGRGINRDVSPALDKSVRRLFLNGEGFLGNAADSIRGPVSAALDELIAGRTSTLGRSINAQIDPLFGRINAQVDPLFGRIGNAARLQIDSTITAVGTSADGTLMPLLDRTVDRLSTRFADNVDGKLSPALNRLVKNAVKTGLGEVQQQGDSFFKKIVPWLGGGLGVVLVAVIVWMHVDRKRKEQTLLALARAVREIPDDAAREEMKNRVKASARRDGVDGYFHTFLEKHEMLGPPPAKIAVPSLVGDPVGAAADQPDA
jgi:hypothetical protein